MSLRRSCLVASALALGAACGASSPHPNGGVDPGGASDGATTTPGSGGSTGGSGGTSDSGGSGGSMDAATAPNDGPSVTASDAAGNGATVPGSAGDQPPERPLAIDKTGAQLFTIKFKP